MGRVRGSASSGDSGVRLMTPSVACIALVSGIDGVRDSAEHDAECMGCSTTQLISSPVLFFPRRLLLVSPSLLSSSLLSETLMLFRSRIHSRILDPTPVPTVYACVKCACAIPLQARRTRRPSLSRLSLAGNLLPRRRRSRRSWRK